MARIKYFVVAEDEKCHNVFSSEDFDEQGRYLANRDYLLSDMDVIATFDNMDAAFAYAERLDN